MDAILDDREVNIVLIHSKSHSMVPLASAALRAGKAVLVEKPGGKSLDDLEALAGLLKKRMVSAKWVIPIGSHRR